MALLVGCLVPTRPATAAAAVFLETDGCGPKPVMCDHHHVSQDVGWCVRWRSIYFLHRGLTWVTKTSLTLAELLPTSTVAWYHAMYCSYFSRGRTALFGVCNEGARLTYHTPCWRDTLRALAWIPPKIQAREVQVCSECSTHGCCTQHSNSVAFLLLCGLTVHACVVNIGRRPRL